MIGPHDGSMGEALKKRREGLAVVISVKPVETLSPEEREKLDKGSDLAPNPAPEGESEMEAEPEMPMEQAHEMDTPLEDEEIDDGPPKSLYGRALKARAIAKRKGM